MIIACSRVTASSLVTKIASKQNDTVNNETYIVVIQLKLTIDFLKV